MIMFINKCIKILLVNIHFLLGFKGTCDIAARCLAIVALLLKKGLSAHNILIQKKFLKDIYFRILLLSCDILHKLKH